MTRQELIEYCLNYPDSYEDYPFDKVKDFEKAWTVMRRKSNRKSFALIYERDGLCVNLKCEPMQADFLRQVYNGVIPAYHMNKTHWNTVYIHSDVPVKEIYEMIEHSYSLTLPNVKRK